MTPLSAAARRRRGTLGPGHLSHRGEHSAPASPGRPARRPPRGSRQKAPGVQRRRSLQGPAVKQNERRKARAREPELPPLDDRIQIPGGLSADALRGGRPPTAHRAVARATAHAAERGSPALPAPLALRGSGYVALAGQCPRPAGRRRTGAWFTCTSVSGGHSVLTNKS